MKKILFIAIFAIATVPCWGEWYFGGELSISQAIYSYSDRVPSSIDRIDGKLSLDASLLIGIEVEEFKGAGYQLRLMFTADEFNVLYKEAYYNKTISYNSVILFFPTGFPNTYTWNLNRIKIMAHFNFALDFVTVAPTVGLNLGTSFHWNNGLFLDFHILYNISQIGAKFFLGAGYRFVKH